MMMIEHDDDVIAEDNDDNDDHDHDHDDNQDVANDEDNEDCAVVLHSSTGRIVFTFVLILMPMSLTMMTMIMKNPH